MDDVIAQLARILWVVRDQHHGQLQALLQTVQFVAQGLAQRRVERGKRLVQQQRTGLRRQCARQGHALALATGKLVRHLLGQRVDVQRLQPLVHLGLARTRARIAPAALQAEADVLAHRQMREQRVVLEHITHVALLRRQVDALRRIKQGAPRHAHMAGIGLQQAGNGLERERLARTRVAQQHHAAMFGAPLQLQMEAPLAGMQHLVNRDIEHALTPPAKQCARAPTCRRPTGWPRR